MSPCRAVLLLGLGAFELACCAGEESLERGPEPVAVAAEPPAFATIGDEVFAAYGLPYEMVEGEPMFTLLEPDAIRAIDEPTFVSVGEALEWMGFEEPVLGVVGEDGTAKCYSAWQLDSHEVVNDVLDGGPIAATW